MVLSFLSLTEPDQPTDKFTIYRAGVPPFAVPDGSGARRSGLAPCRPRHMLRLRSSCHRQRSDSRPVSMRYEPFSSSAVCYPRSIETAPQIPVYGADKNLHVPNSVQHNLPGGYLRGKRRTCWKKIIQFAFPLGRPESPRTMRKVLGDSLHTFSSVRKYDRPLMLQVSAP